MSCVFCGKDSRECACSCSAGAPNLKEASEQLIDVIKNAKKLTLVQRVQLLEETVQDQEEQIQLLREEVGK